MHAPTRAPMLLARGGGGGGGCCPPAWGQGGCAGLPPWVMAAIPPPPPSQGGKPGGIWSLRSHRGTPMSSLSVANPKCPSVLAPGGGRRKWGALPLPPSPGGTPSPCSPPAPLSLLPVFLCYRLTELPSSHGTPALSGPPEVGEGLGVFPHLWVCKGVFRGSWHLQACRWGLGGLLACLSMQGRLGGGVPAPPGMRGVCVSLGSYRTSGHAGGVGGAPGTSTCAGGGGGFWHLRAFCWGLGRLPAPPCMLEGLGGLLAPPCVLGGLGGSQHLQACWGDLGGSRHLQIFWGSLRAPSIFRYLQMFWGLLASPGMFGGLGGLLAPPGMLGVLGGSCPPPPPFSRRGAPSSVFEHFLR